jgi:hypothetical protein
MDLQSIITAATVNERVTGATQCAVKQTHC